MAVVRSDEIDVPGGVIVGDATVGPGAELVVVTGVVDGGGGTTGGGTVEIALPPELSVSDEMVLGSSGGWTIPAGETDKAFGA